MFNAFGNKLEKKRSYAKNTVVAAANTPGAPKKCQSPEVFGGT